MRSLRGVFAAGLCLFPALASAQSSLAGVARDTSGAVLPVPQLGAGAHLHPDVQSRLLITKGTKAFGHEENRKAFAFQACSRGELARHAAKPPILWISHAFFPQSARIVA